MQELLLVLPLVLEMSTPLAEYKLIYSQSGSTTAWTKQIHGHYSRHLQFPNLRITEQTTLKTDNIQPKPV